MKRIAQLFGAALLVTAFCFSGDAAGRFDQKLLLDKQIVHVLNRLTFGPRPGDVQQVRLMGVDKWIDQQLHPERIAENPALDAKLKPLESMNLPMWKIMEKYSPQGVQLPPPPSQVVMRSLTPQMQAQLRNGTVEERLGILASLGSFEREKVLAASASNPLMLEGLPDNLKQEAAKARQTEQDELQKERMRLMPPLSELLTAEQTRTARQGTRDEKLALINSFESPKRQQILRALGPGPFADIPDLRREVMLITQPQQVANAELIENKLYRAIYSNRQLEEVLVDFWINHFNIYNGKGQDRLYLTTFERDAIRPYVLGHFKDMLLATAHHPAMLFYLDNWQSQVPRDDLPGQIPPPLGAQRPGLNENYGRELLELHTLGVDGGYTQQDVIAVARAFSGWSIYDTAKYAEFQFNPATHDRKEKVILGHTLPAGRGEQDGLDVIDILAHHPSTAKFISKKLAQRFVADDPPQALVDRMAATFTKTDGDLRAVLQTMFSSVEFMSEGAWQAKMKSPLEMVVSSVRAVNADVSDTTALAQRIAELGQPLYGKVEPTGYPNTGEAWTNTASVLGRINFATALLGGPMPGIKVDMSRFNFKDPSAVAGDLLSTAPSPQTLASIEKGIQSKEATPSLITTLVLSSPDFQRR
jgi:uncharacterized protein (DUF1800 family)